MIIKKEIELEFDITDFDFSCDEIKEAVLYNLTREEQKRIVLSVLHSCNYDEFQEIIASILKTLDYDITDFDFSCDELKEAVQYNLTREEQKRIVLSVLHSRNYDEIQEIIASILETLSIENAKEIIQNLDNLFLTREQYRTNVKG